MKKVLPVVVISFVLLTAAGCTGGSASTGGSAATTSSSVVASPAASRPSSIELRWLDVDGFELPFDMTTRAVAAIGHDGSLLTSQSTPDENGNPRCGGTVSLWNDDRDVVLLKPGSSAEATYCAYDGDESDGTWVWWGDANSTELFATPWHLWISVKGAAAQEIDRYVATDSGQPVSTPLLYPHIEGGSIVYAAGDGTTANVRLAKANDEWRPADLEPDSGDAVVVQDLAFVVKHDPSSSDQSAFVLQRIDLSTGKRSILPGSVGASFAANNSSLLVVRPDGALNVFDLSGNPVQTLRLPVGRIGPIDDLDDGFVFSDERSSYLLVSRGDTWVFVDLGGRPYANSISGNGNWVFWVDAPTVAQRTDDGTGTTPRGVYRRAQVDDILAAASTLAYVADD